METMRNGFFVNDRRVSGRSGAKKEGFRKKEKRQRGRKCCKLQWEEEEEEEEKREENSKADSEGSLFSSPLFPSSQASGELHDIPLLSFSLFIPILILLSFCINPQVETKIEQTTYSKCYRLSWLLFCSCIT